MRVSPLAVSLPHSWDIRESLASGDYVVVRRTLKRKIAVKNSLTIAYCKCVCPPPRPEFLEDLPKTNQFLRKKERTKGRKKVHWDLFFFFESFKTLVLQAEQSTLKSPSPTKKKEKNFHSTCFIRYACSFFPPSCPSALKCLVSSNLTSNDSPLIIHPPTVSV